MTLAKLSVKGLDYSWKQTGFVCEKDNCLRCYDITRGYYTIGRTHAGDRLRVPCPDHKIAMYIADFQGEEGKWLFRCPKPGCRKSRARSIEAK